MNSFCLYSRVLNCTASTWSNAREFNRVQNTFEWNCIRIKMDGKSVSVTVDKHVVLFGVKLFRIEGFSLSFPRLVERLKMEKRWKMSSTWEQMYSVLVLWVCCAVVTLISSFCFWWHYFCYRFAAFLISNIFPPFFSRPPPSMLEYCPFSFELNHSSQHTKMYIFMADWP